MIFASAFTVYVLGLRHGADPDHLAAIDSMTRNAAVRSPRLSRFVGAFFAGGHTVMVIAIAALVGLLGTRFAAHGDLVERIGTWISIVVLVLLAALNLRQLARGETDRVMGARLGCCPKRCAKAVIRPSPSSSACSSASALKRRARVAAYATAFGAHAGIAGAVLVGAMFCLGMITTDTLDSVLVTGSLRTVRGVCHRSCACGSGR